MERVFLTKADECSDKEIEKLLSMVERHWIIHDQMEEEEEPSHWEDMMANLMRDRFSQAKDGRITLPCLWKPDCPPVKNNFDYALVRLRSLLNSKLLRDPKVREAYDQVFKKWESEGIIESIRVDNPSCLLYTSPSPRDRG